jgi:acetamidase/formamidase
VENPPGGPLTLHDLRGDAFNYAWDNSIEPAIEINSGDSVEFHVRDASDEQITATSGAADVEKLYSLYRCVDS